VNLDEKLKLIAETLDADPAAIIPSAGLSALEEWDSMGVISIIAMLDRKFGKILTAEQISSLCTVQDILDRME